MPSKSRPQVLTSAEEVAFQAAAELARAAQQAATARGVFNVALSGGSTPLAMYQYLTQEPYRSSVPWTSVHFFWSDERCVPPDHPDSNYGAAARALLKPLDIPEANVHRVRGEDAPDDAAGAYEQEILGAIPDRPPRFDLVLLGMGDDGHTASLFPDTAALDALDRLVVANYVPKLDAFRITFTPVLINAAREVMFLVAGKGKAEALRAVLEGERNPRLYPAQVVAPADGSLTWLVDRAAASMLTAV